MDSILSQNQSKPPSQEKGLIPEPIKIVLLVALVLAVAYLFYDINSSRKATQADLDKIYDQLHGLEKKSKQTEAAVSNQGSTLKSDLAALGSHQTALKTELKTEFKKTAAQI